MRARGSARRSEPTDGRFPSGAWEPETRRPRVLAQLDCSTPAAPQQPGRFLGRNAGPTRLEAGVYLGAKTVIFSRSAHNFEESAFWFPDLVNLQFTDSNFRGRINREGENSTGENRDNRETGFS